MEEDLERIRDPMKGKTRIDDDIAFRAGIAHRIVDHFVDRRIVLGRFAQLGHREPALDCDFAPEISAREVLIAEHTRNTLRSTRFAAAGETPDGDDMFFHVKT